MILEWWKEYRDRGHEGWAYLFKTGLVGRAEALQWKDEVWGARNKGGERVGVDAVSISSRERLEASKPQRGQFNDEESFEEALGRWMENQGRILALARSAKKPQQD
jgi:hypothetical protein